MRRLIITGLVAVSVLTGCGQGPQCWEDEVRVVVYEDPYGDLTGTLGCVPADNLPVDGFRP